MIREREYTSTLAPHMRGLVAAKRSLGFDYSAEAYTLKRLDQFCEENDFRQTMITFELAQSWAGAIPSEGGASRQSRMSVLRQLALYEQSLGLDAYVAHNFATREKPVVYIPTYRETRLLFAVIDAYKDKRYWYMAEGYRVAFRLMRCCGMRIAECANMARADVDVQEKTLLVRHSKGAKDRIVYMADDLAEMIDRYINRCAEGLGFWPEWLFPGRDPSTHIFKSTFDKKFAQFWAQVPGSGEHGKHPTPHSLRHAFVIDRMNRWMAQGVCLSQMMPYLSAYLGHGGPHETFYYYHQVDEAMSIVRSRDAVSARVIPEVVFYEA